MSEFNPVFDFKFKRLAFLKDWHWSEGYHLGNFKCIKKIGDFAIFWEQKNG